MVSQTVLLKGVNDRVETLEALMRGFVETRVKPYYLHHPDLAPGTSHFRLTIAEGQALMRGAAPPASPASPCRPTCSTFPTRAARSRSARPISKARRRTMSPTDPGGGRRLLRLG